MRWVSILIAVAACHNAGGGDDDDQGGDGGPRGGDGGGDGAQTAPGVFDPAVTDVLVEIDFEAGQAPFTGPVIGFGDTFDITDANIGRLFSGKKTLAIPRVIADMQNVGMIADEELTVGDILALAAQHRDQADTPTRKTYYVLFVSGHFTDENGPNAQVLGVSIGDTGVVAMFKDVIKGSSNVGNVQRFVEQSTLVHELGHAIGLVDNGVPLTSPHKDAPHGAHCSNQDCVMFFANEGTSAMLQFVQNHVLANDSILFAADCLADVDALTGGP